MAHKRVLLPAEFAQGERLTSDLVGIGVRLASRAPNKEPNIEDTLVAASIEGLALEDYRVLALLVDWMGIHSDRVNVDRLTKMIQLVQGPRLTAFWAAIAQWRRQDWRFRKLQAIYNGHRVDLSTEGGDFQIKRYGEDVRFADTVLRVPEKLLRQRPQDILCPAALAKQHKAYAARIAIGPSYRADMWALMARQPDLAAAEIARQTYGSFPTAWEAKRDWALLHA